MFSLFFIPCYRCHPDLHSFPTRRSSDLATRRDTRLADALLRNLGAARAAGACRACRCRAGATPRRRAPGGDTCSARRSEEHTSELQSRGHLVCRLLLEKKNKQTERSCII